MTPQLIIVPAYECPVCGYLTRDKSNAEKHIEISTVELPKGLVFKNTDRLNLVGIVGNVLKYNEVHYAIHNVVYYSMNREEAKVFHALRAEEFESLLINRQIELLTEADMLQFNLNHPQLRETFGYKLQRTTPKINGILKKLKSGGSK
jgi:hypothetical protein